MSDGLPRVLCVDDEPNLLAALRRSLRGRFEVSLAQSALDALQALEHAGPFAIVITDLCMPGMNGIELLDRIRARWPLTARILLSGHGATAASDHALAAGAAFRCLAKPFPAQDLHVAINEAIVASRVPPPL